MKYLAGAAFAVAGLINLFALTGVLGGAQLQSLYGLPVADEGMLLLMRHRALLFGLVGGLLVLAAFRPQHRAVASWIGLFSMASFMALAWPPQQYSAELQRVFWADAAGCLALVIGIVASRSTRQPPP